MLAGTAGGYVAVLARLLFDEQAEVVCHEVDAPLQAETFADERRFEHGAAAVVLGEHHADGLTYVFRLPLGLRLEFFCVETCAGAVFKSLVGEIAAHRFGKAERASFIDYVVENGPGEVAKQYGLAVRTWLHAVESVCQGVVPVVLEAGRYGADVYQIVRLNDDESGRYYGCCVCGQSLLGRSLAVHLAVKEVELHAFTHRFSQVCKVFGAVVYGQCLSVKPLFCRHIYV